MMIMIGIMIAIIITTMRTAMIIIMIIIVSTTTGSRGYVIRLIPKRKFITSRSMVCNEKPLALLKIIIPLSHNREPVHRQS